jgi:hypothetical protein
MPAGIAAATGTTVTPAGAVFNVALSARAAASFVTDIGTVTCSQSTSTGSVPASPNNANEEEESTVHLPFETPTFERCSFPGASSATVVSNSSARWGAAAFGDAEERDDTLALALPAEALRITIVTNVGTCTIITPTEAATLIGAWTDGTSEVASTAQFSVNADYTASGTCVAGCAHLESAGYLVAELRYDLTNERGGSAIAF